MSKIFITGSEGFIGSHLAEYFINKGYQVSALVLYNSFGNIGNLSFLHKTNLKKIKIIFGDLKDPGTYSQILRNSDFVINCASLISIPYSYKAKKSYIENNIVGSSIFFDECLASKKIRKIIHFSSSEIYGTPEKLPITEKTPHNPQSPYAATKLAVDYLAKSYFYSYNLPIVILRPFNNFGPRQSRRAVIPEIICQSLLSNQLKLGDISTKRDFLHVDDTVQAVQKLILKKNVLGEEYNIGTCNYYKIKDIINLISEIQFKKLKIKTSKIKLRPKKSEVRELLCDFSKAKKELNWNPKVFSRSAMKNKLTELINFYKKNLEKYLQNNYN